MKVFDFSHWPERLAQAPLSDRNKHSFAITIRWYLSFCRRGRGEVNHQSARDFIAWVELEKKPQPWQLEEWKEAIRWFFREANRPVPGAQCGVSGQTAYSGPRMRKSGAPGTDAPYRKEWPKGEPPTLNAQHSAPNIPGKVGSEPELVRGRETPGWKTALDPGIAHSALPMADRTDVPDVGEAV